MTDARDIRDLHKILYRNGKKNRCSSRQNISSLAKFIRLSQFDKLKQLFNFNHQVSHSMTDILSQVSREMLKGDSRD